MESIQNQTLKIKPQDLKTLGLVAHVASGKSVEDAAAEVGLKRCQASKRLNSPLAQEFLGNSAEEIKTILESRLPNLLTKSLDYLENIVDSKFCSSDVRIKAAGLIIKLAALTQQKPS